MAHNRSAPPTRSTTPAPGMSGMQTPAGLSMTNMQERAQQGLSQAAIDRLSNERR